MLSSKQRAILKSQANDMEVILHIGKNGITSTILKQTNDALAAREMIKGKVLDNAMLNAKEAAAELSEAAECEVVQVIGSKFILYKRNNKNPVYRLTQK